jgi:hypothetical protein
VQTNILQIHGKVMVDHHAWQGHSSGEDGSLADNYYRRDGRYRPNITITERGCGCYSCLLKPRPRKMVAVEDWPHDPADPKSLKQPVPDEFYLLCASTIGGYALQERKWGRFH